MGGIQMKSFLIVLFGVVLLMGCVRPNSDPEETPPAAGPQSDEDEEKVGQKKLQLKQSFYQLSVLEKPQKEEATADQGQTATQAAPPAKTLESQQGLMKGDSIFVSAAGTKEMAVPAGQCIMLTKNQVATLMVQVRRCPPGTPACQEDQKVKKVACNNSSSVKDQNDCTKLDSETAHFIWHAVVRQARPASQAIGQDRSCLELVAGRPVHKTDAQKKAEEEAAKKAAAAQQPAAGGEQNPAATGNGGGTNTPNEQGGGNPSPQ